MALTFALNSGYVFVAGEKLTLAKLNQMFSSGSGSLLSGTIETDEIGNSQVTAAKLNATLDLSGKSITLPTNLRPKTSVAAAPDFVGQVSIVSGEFFIATGTSAASDWELVTGVKDAITAAPTAIGQIAYNGTNLYLAIGTAASTDWVPCRFGAVDLEVLSAAADAPVAGRARLFVSDHAGNEDLYLKRSAGTLLNLSATTISGALAAEASPDWDSGWTRISATLHRVYDLAAATFDTNVNNVDASNGIGGFSYTTKGDQVDSLGADYTTKWGITNPSAAFPYTPAENAITHAITLGWRTGRVLLRRAINQVGPVTYDDIIVGGLCHTYNNVGWSVRIDPSAGKAYFLLANTTPWYSHTTEPAGSMDWNSLNVTDLLVRIQLWT